MRIRLFDPAVHPRFDDLPWSSPLERWDHRRLIDMPLGLHRHVVRFVNYDGRIYALKELPPRLAAREYRLLRTLNDRDLPVVAAVALVDRRGDPDPVLITRYLHYAMPYRLLFAERTGTDVTEILVESIATLLARLHTAGFYWGDCSLSNALFRRDELHLCGYALDTETGELYDRLSDGQRWSDVELAVVNVAGGLADLAAAGQLPDAIDPFEVAPRLADMYHGVWEELHGVSIYDSSDPTAFDRRLARLHDLGFGVHEAILTDAPGSTSGAMSFRPSALAGGYHRRELVELTGIVAREHQAQRLLEDIRNYRDHLERELDGPSTLRDVGHRWLTEVYDPVLASVPRDIADKVERTQLFIEVLDHHARYGSSSHQVDRLEPLVRAARSYARDVLARRAHERTSANWGETESERP